MNGLPLLLVEALATRNDSGLGRLARLVVDGLQGLVGDAEIRVILSRSGTYRPGFPCITLPVGAKPFRLWSQAALPWMISRMRPRVVLCLGQTLPLWRPASRYALLIPDAGPLEDLGRPASSHDDYNRRWLTRMPAKADRILTIGQFSKERLMHLLGLPGERISIVKPIRRNAAPRPQERSSRVFPPRGSYLLAVGNVEPRKNFPGLIAAYSLLRSRQLDWSRLSDRSRPEIPPLYIVGHKAWGYAEAADAARRHGVADQVHFTGFVSEGERETFLSGCAMFISSSLYEGWGLPLFEALTLGKPSIYHRGSSQEEFASGFALSVDCSDAAALAQAMERLLTDGGERARLEAALARDFGKVLDYDLEGALRQALLPLLTG